MIRACVRITNLEQESKIVYSVTTVGQLSEVNTVLNMLSDESLLSANMLAGMLQKTEDTLNPKQQNEAKAFF